RVGDDEVRALDRAWHDVLEVGAQVLVRALGSHQKGEVVHRQDAAGAAQGRQHEVGRVIDVDRPAEPVSGDGYVGSVPQDGQPALTQSDFAAREVACP